MVARVAMHVIRRTVKPGVAASKDSPAQAPVVEEVQPGTLFDVEGDELDQLEAAGAVVPPEDKRAAKFGFGKDGPIQIGKQEGETEESAAARRKTAASARKTGARKDPLVADDD